MLDELVQEFVDRVQSGQSYANGRVVGAGVGRGVGTGVVLGRYSGG